MGIAFGKSQSFVVTNEQFIAVICGDGEVFDLGAKFGMIFFDFFTSSPEVLFELFYNFLKVFVDFFGDSFHNDGFVS